MSTFGDIKIDAPQDSQGADPSRISIPRPPAAKPERNISNFYVLDRILVLLVMALAFLAASFPARNSDVWLHLASGRLLVEEGFRGVGDPFVHTAGASTAVNHSWLYDLLTYGLYASLNGLHAGLGGTALVVVKALLAVLLALLALVTARRGSSLWLPVVGATLTVVVASPWLALRPTCVSYLFLALTLFLLERPHTAASQGPGSPATGRRRWQSVWLLVPLFALWVNLDSWFLLGPLAVLLYWLGQWDQPERRRSLGLVLLAGVAVCLLNPGHVYAFADLPAELGLSEPSRVLEHDPLGDPQRISPFFEVYLRSPSNLSVAGLAYWMLVCLGVVSFFLTLKNLRWARLLLWLGLFALSAYQVRTAAFFAVVAGPVAALNLYEFACRRAAQRQRMPDPAWLVGGRLLTGLGLLVLAVVAWPGWLYGRAAQPRDWSVEPDPGLEGAAAQIASWRQEGKLGRDARGFNYSLDAADYLAWFGDGEKSFLDRHLHSTEATAADYVAVRNGLAASASVPHHPGKSAADWRQILRNYRVAYIVLHDSDPNRLTLPLSQMYAAPAEWPLLHLQGETALFGWRDPQRPQDKDRFAALELDLGRLAYDPVTAEKAPPEGPARLAEAPDWWAPFVTPANPRTPWRDKAFAYRVHFKTLEATYRARRTRVWENSLAAAIVATPAGLATPAGPSLMLLDAYTLDTSQRRLTMRLDQPKQLAPAHILGIARTREFEDAKDDGPLGSLLLSIRAARRAIHDNPDDALAYLLLGQSYMQLTHNTRERQWQRIFPTLQRLRQVQASAAFNQALLLRPNLLGARDALGDLYHEMGYDDLQLEQLNAWYEGTLAAGPAPRESRPQFAARTANRKKVIEELEGNVRKQKEECDLQGAKFRILDKARLALGHKLGGLALETLLSSDVAAFGEDGMALELSLLLSTGRLKDAKDWITPDDIRKALGGANVSWLQAEIAAATGNYASAIANLGSIVVSAANLPSISKDALPIQQAMALSVGRGLLEQVPAPRMHITETMPEVVSQTMKLAQTLHEGANLQVLRGLLALEAGEIADARTLFRAGLDGLPRDSRAGAAVVARQCLELLATKGDLPATGPAGPR